MAELLDVAMRTYQNYESHRIPWGQINRIAKITGKSPEWLLHGEPMKTLGSIQNSVQSTQLDQIEAGVHALHEKLDRLLDAVGAKPSGGDLAEQMQRMTEQVEAALSPLAQPDAESASPADQSRRKRRPPAKKD